MKRILLLSLLILIMMSLCACDSTMDTVTTVTTGNMHVERHYQDNGDLVCIKETNTETGVIVTTYFYWQHDEHGRRTLSGTECITVDGDGKIVAHEFSPGHS